MDKRKLLLYAITDCDHLSGEVLLKRTEAILAGGATILQYRDKHGRAREDVLALKALCGKYEVPFIVNDDVELALEVDADGVHVGQEDMACLGAREMLGPNKIVGVTAKTVEQARKAVADGADYLGVGALFPSKSKDSSLTSRETFKEICQSVSVPVVGIGGVNENNVATLAGTGASGAAVISALYALPEPLLATKRLHKKLSVIVDGDPSLSGVICDVDGTLADTATFCRDLLPNYLRDEGYRPGEDLPEIIAGKALPEAIAYAKHNYSCGYNVGQVSEELVAKYRVYCFSDAEEKPGAKAFLEACKQAQTPFVLMTNAPEECVRALCEHIGMNMADTVVVSGWNKRLSEADSMLAKMAVESLKGKETKIYENTSIWAFNDSLPGVLGAKGAGVRIAAMHDDGVSDKEWQQILKLADAAFWSWEEAREWLNACG